MPWETCSIHGCTTSRKDRGVGIFKLPGNLKSQKKWRDKILETLSGRKGYDEFWKLSRNKEARICERHFNHEDVETYTLPHIHPPRRRLKAGAIPDKDLPPPLQSAEKLSTVVRKPMPQKPLNEFSHNMKIPTIIDRPAKRKFNGIEPPPLPRKKSRTMGVGTSDHVTFRHFCCQVGESYLKKKSGSS